MLREDFFLQHPVACAQALIGCTLTWNGCSGLVVETEAYAAEDDESCHIFFRPSTREFVKKNRPGAAYVYFNYGMHWLANVLVKGEMEGFVLLRAIEPRQGLRRMRERRGMRDERALCSGPGKLTQALGITGEHHGRSFCRSRRRCFLVREEEPAGIIADKRIGISKATDHPWRFLLRDNPFVSKPPAAGN